MSTLKELGRTIVDLAATSTHAICVIDPEASGVEKLAKNGIELIALFRDTDLRQG